MTVVKRVLMVDTVKAGENCRRSMAGSGGRRGKALRRALAAVAGAAADNAYARGSGAA